MTRSVKVLLFFVAVVGMASLALASIMMADGKGWLATLFFIVAFVIIGFGFVTRRKALSQDVPATKL
jgi:uncharacterized membrane protein SirB2